MVSGHGDSAGAVGSGPGVRTSVFPALQVAPLMKLAVEASVSTVKLIRLPATAVDVALALTDSLLLLAVRAAARPSEVSAAAAVRTASTLVLTSR
jgi:hypothetical protein